MASSPEFSTFRSSNPTASDHLKQNSTSFPPTSNTSSSSSLPYDILTESANKIFGFENFGNTCYCNSVLQCLYYSKPFREQVLNFASEYKTSTKRRTTVPGSSPHSFTVDYHNNASSQIPSSSSSSFSHANNGNPAQASTPIAAALASAQAQQEARQRAAQLNGNSTQDHSSEPKKNQSSLGRKLSIFGGNKNKDAHSEKNDTSISEDSSANGTNNNNNNSSTASSNDNLNDHSNQNGNNSALQDLSESNPNNHVHHEEHEHYNDNNHLAISSLFESNSPTSYAISKYLYPGLQGIMLGIRIPGQNIPIVGYTDDPFATQEMRKRAALVKGPIVNMDQSFSDNYSMKESLFTSLKDIFECMAESSSRIGVVSPVKLIQVLKRENELFRSSMHQDAHEFLNFLLNEVIENVDRQNRLIGSKANGNKTNNDAALTPSSKSRWVHDLFEGLLTSETKCLTCENVSRRDEQFLDLSIDIERNTSVTACLRQFSASETLCERNKFNCDNCGGFHEAQKRMKVKKLPKILALHLKRFKYTEDLQRNVKLFHRVVYPRYLRLFDTTHDAQDPDKLYELYAVVVHIGGGPYHGHYVSIVKTEHAGWLLFDDEMVEAVDPNYVFNFFGDNKSLATAYVLFYQEVSPEQYEHENLYANNNLSNSFHSPVTVNGNGHGFNAGIGPYGASSVISPTPMAASTVTTLSTQVEDLEQSTPFANNSTINTTTEQALHQQDSQPYQPVKTPTSLDDHNNNLLTRKRSHLIPFSHSKRLQNPNNENRSSFEGQNNSTDPPANTDEDNFNRNETLNSHKATTSKASPQMVPVTKQTSLHGLSRFKSGTLSRRSLSLGQNNFTSPNLPLQSPTTTTTTTTTSHNDNNGGSFWKRGNSHHNHENEPLEESKKVDHAENQRPITPTTPTTPTTASLSNGNGAPLSKRKSRHLSFTFKKK